MRPILALLLASTLYAQQVSTGSAYSTYLIGPQIQFNTTPFSMFDTTEAQAASLAVFNYQPGQMEAPYFLLSDVGVIAINNGSMTVTGSGGATLQAGGCNGTTTPRSGASLVIHYVGLDVVARNTIVGIDGCPGANTLTIHYPWVQRSGSFFPSCTPCSFTYYIQYSGKTTSLWDLGGAPANYYGNDMALRIHHFRLNNGETTFLNKAQQITDWTMQDPQRDRGSAYYNWTDGGGPYPYPIRSLALYGVFLRAEEDTSLWVGLRQFRDRWSAAYIPFYAGWGQMYDPRDESYILSYLAAGAMGDPNPTEAATWLAAIATFKSTVWDPFKMTASNPWASMSFRCSSWSTGEAGSCGGPGSSVSVTSGSTAVVLNGATWQHADIANCGVGGYGTDPGCIMFFSGLSRPSVNSSTYYGVTWVDATHGILDRPYAGSTDAASGWLLGDINSGLTAVGFQPFIMGLLATAFEQAAKAFDGHDATIAMSFRSYNDIAVSAIMTYGYWPLMNSMYYGAQYVNCQFPISDSSLQCGGQDSNVQYNRSATLSDTYETIRGLALNYARTGSATVKSFGDAILTQTWTPQGPCYGAGTTVLYSVDWDANCIGMSGGAYQILVNLTTKFTGETFGYGDNSTWWATTPPASIPNGKRINLSVRQSIVIR